MQASSSHSYTDVSKLRRLVTRLTMGFSPFRLRCKTTMCVYAILIPAPPSSTLQPRIWYASLFADINHLERIQRLATRLVTDMRHLPYEERLQRLGLHSLQRRRLRDDLLTAFKIFKGLLDIDMNLFFPSSRSTRPKRAPLQGTPRCEPPPKVRVVIFGEGCEILE